jgi:hypothetical protein
LEVSVLRYATILVLLLTTACNPSGCEEKKQTVEVDTRSYLYDLQYKNVEAWRSYGYDCQATSISGTRTLYTCTKCD